jgi:nitroimidazol reductase NimA-like FMN-containing flavoprotein (pyridoxamine 5'-phosphate oxidase superfamily)
MAKRGINDVIDKPKGEIIRFLQQHRVAHLAISGPDGPWAAVVRFINDDLTLYLVEPRAGDLDYYIENDSKVVLTVSRPRADPGEDQQESVQLFGIARVLAAHEIRETPDDVQRVYSRIDRQMPGVYAVIEVKPRQIHRVKHGNGTIHRDTVDIDMADRKG